MMVGTPKYFSTRLELAILSIEHKSTFTIEERLESLYIIYCKLHVQDEALYRLGYTNLRKENT